MYPEVPWLVGTGNSCWGQLPNAEGFVLLACGLIFLLSCVTIHMANRVRSIYGIGQALICLAMDYHLFLDTFGFI